MNKKVKKMWIAALTSGKYKQGKGQLRSGNKFCCLGVLCNLHAQAHPEIAAKQKIAELYMGSWARLPREVIKWAELGSEDGAYVTSANTTLVSDNDDGCSFPEIAQIIKEKF